MTRGDFLRLSAGALAACTLGGRALQAIAAPAPAMQTRPIPSTGKPLPVIGLGTYQGFDVAPGSAAYAQLPDIGVRSSWLMLARKVLLARLAVSAASLATDRSLVRSATRDSRW